MSCKAKRSSIFVIELTSKVCCARKINTLMMMRFFITGGISLKTTRTKFCHAIIPELVMQITIIIWENISGLSSKL